MENSRKGREKGKKKKTRTYGLYLFCFSAGRCRTTTTWMRLTATVTENGNWNCCGIAMLVATIASRSGIATATASVIFATTLFFVSLCFRFKDATSNGPRHRRAL